MKVVLKNNRFTMDREVVLHKAPTKVALNTNNKPKLDFNALRIANKDILEREKFALELFFSTNGSIADSNTK